MLVGTSCAPAAGTAVGGVVCLRVLCASLVSWLPGRLVIPMSVKVRDLLAVCVLDVSGFRLRAGVGDGGASSGVVGG